MIHNSGQRHYGTASVQNSHAKVNSVGDDSNEAVISRPPVDPNVALGVPGSSS